MKPAKWKLADKLFIILMLMFMFIWTIGCLICIGAIFDAESYQINCFGITGDTLRGALTCLAITVIFLSLSTKGYLISKEHNQGMEPTSANAQSIVPEG